MRSPRCGRPGSSSPSWAKRVTLPTSKGPAPVKGYDLYLPLRYNDGTDIELRNFKDLQRRLPAEFGGVPPSSLARVDGEGRPIQVRVRRSHPPEVGRDELKNTSRPALSLLPGGPSAGATSRAAEDPVAR